MKRSTVWHGLTRRWSTAEALSIWVLRCAARGCDPRPVTRSDAALSWRTDARPERSPTVLETSYSRPALVHARSDGLQWPQRDGLKWPHFASFDLPL